jgi:L-fuculose-phosphate aldolase
MNFDQARREVLSTCLALADKGYLAGTGGNVAYRIGDEYFALTPSATDYYSMVPEDICVLRLDNLAHVEGHRQPSVEHRLHAYVLRTRRDCNASIHTHQPIASAYTLLGRELEIRDPNHRLILGSQVALVNYAPSGTSWLASKLAKALKPHINAYFLRNHGVVCCGETLEESVLRLKALEAACAAFFRRAISTCMTSDPDPSLPAVLTMLATFEDMEFAK